MARRTVTARVAVFACRIALGRICLTWDHEEPSQAMTPPSLPKTLLDAARDRMLIPFAGAGVSRAVQRPDGIYAFPTWGELLEAAAARLAAEGRDEYANVVRNLLRFAKPDYLEIAKKAKQGLGALWIPFLRERFATRIDEINDPTLALARTIWRLGSNLVITTNYDSVLSWACPRYHDLERWEIQSVSGQVELLRKRLQRPTLWQLHGSIGTAERLILTPDGYHELYDDQPNPIYRAALESLRHVMIANHLLFVGFSFDDAYIARQLDWVQQTFAGCGGPHYLLAREADFGRMREKLDGSAITPIMYKDHGVPLLRRLEEIIAVVEPRSLEAEPPPAAPPPAVGQSVQSGQAKRQRTQKQTRREFLAACPPAVAKFFDELIDDTVRRGHSIVWGTKGFTIRVNWGNGIGLAYGYPPGVGGAEHAELRMYLAEALPADFRLRAQKQYEAAAPFQNGGAFTLKLPLDGDEATLEAARRSVNELWKAAERLLAT
jgi:hypothetical protein